MTARLWTQAAKLTNKMMVRLLTQTKLANEITARLLAQTTELTNEIMAMFLTQNGRKNKDRAVKDKSRGLFTL